MLRILTIAALLLLTAYTPAHADFADGKTAYDAKQWDKAVMALRPLAESGDARAMVLLGNMYARGYGVAQSNQEAYGLYQRAALAGNGEAMVVTAAMLQQGIGTPANVPLAIAWYRRAAETGQPGGALFYGLYLFRGNKAADAQDNLLPDAAAAYQWLRIAEKNSKDTKLKEMAGKIAAEIAKQLPAAEVAMLDSAATAWTPTALKDLSPAPGTPSP